MAPKIGIPALGTLGTVIDTVDLVRRAWSTFNLPASFAPTMDVEELDKRIADLKAVEQWLNVNLSMLRGTIQGMEIQRGTLAAVKAFGRAVVPGAADRADAAEPTFAAMAPPAPVVVEPPAPAPRKKKKSAGAKPASRTALGMLGDTAASAVSPAAWWNLLQSQFNQVAQAALSGAGLTEAQRAGASADQPADKPSRAPVARKPASKARRKSSARSKKARPAAGGQPD